METIGAKKIIVDLDNSLFARGFSEDNLIHPQIRNHPQKMI